MSTIEYRNPPRSQNNAEQRPSGAFVLLAIVATLMLLLAMLSLLFYRSLTQRAPANALVVQADERWRGVSLLVEGPGLARPLEATLDKANKYVVSFFLDPGMYFLRVRNGEREMLRQPLELGSDVDTMGIDLTRSELKPPSTQPATQPAK